MGKTTIICSDTVLVLDTLDTQTYACPLSLDALTHRIRVWDPARVILYVRHDGLIPSHIIGVTKCAM